MTAAVTWRDAQSKDRAIVQGLYCTSPAPCLPNGRSLPHPKPWEQEVQAYLKRNPPPGRGENFYRLGLAKDGHALAVGIACHFPEPSIMPVFKILAIGVSVEVRGSGGSVADAALQDMLEQIAARVAADGRNEFTVFGLVARENHASEKMCGRAAFATSDEGRGAYRRWSAVVALS